MAEQQFKFKREPAIRVFARELSSTGLRKWVQRERKLLTLVEGMISSRNKKGILSGCSAKTQDKNYPYNSKK